MYLPYCRPAVWTLMNNPIPRVLQRCKDYRLVWIFFVLDFQVPTVTWSLHVSTVFANVSILTSSMWNRYIQSSLYHAPSRKLAYVLISSRPWRIQGGVKIILLFYMQSAQTEGSLAFRPYILNALPAKYIWIWSCNVGEVLNPLW